MNKILWISGIIIIGVILLGAWLLIGEFSGFAFNLGEESKDIGTNEKTKFIGIWETTYIEDDNRFIGQNGIYKFSIDGTGTIGGLTCTWDINEGNLTIDHEGEREPIFYNYTFTNNDTLILTNINGSLEFSKKE